MGALFAPLLRGLGWALPIGATGYALSSGGDAVKKTSDAGQKLVPIVVIGVALIIFLVIMTRKPARRTYTRRKK